MINDFLTARQALFGQLARSICLRFRIHPGLHADDVQQIVAMTALAMVHEHLRGTLGARRFEALLTVRARSEVRAHFDSASQTPLSEMTTVKRRLRKLGEKRRQLVAELGREPTADEVVTQWNTEARTRFTDPARQGMLATVTDLVDVRAPRRPGRHRPAAPADTGPLDAARGPGVPRRSARRDPLRRSGSRRRRGGLGRRRAGRPAVRPLPRRDRRAARCPAPRRRRRDRHGPRHRRTHPGRPVRHHRARRRGTRRG